MEVSPTMAPAMETTLSNAVMGINGPAFLNDCPLRERGSEAISHAIDMSGRMYPREQIPVYFGGQGPIGP